MFKKKNNNKGKIPTQTFIFGALIVFAFAMGLSPLTIFQFVSDLLAGLALKCVPGFERFSGGLNANQTEELRLLIDEYKSKNEKELRQFSSVILDQLGYALKDLRDLIAINHSEFLSSFDNFIFEVRSIKHMLDELVAITTAVNEIPIVVYNPIYGYSSVVSSEVIKLHSPIDLVQEIRQASGSDVIEVILLTPAYPTMNHEFYYEYYFNKYNLEELCKDNKVEPIELDGLETPKWMVRIDSEEMTSSEIRDLIDKLINSHNKQIARCVHELKLISENNPVNLKPVSSSKIRKYLREISELSQIRSDDELSDIAKSHAKYLKIVLQDDDITKNSYSFLAAIYEEIKVIYAKYEGVTLASVNDESNIDPDRFAVYEEAIINSTPGLDEIWCEIAVRNMAAKNIDMFRNIMIAHGLAGLLESNGKGDIIGLLVEAGFNYKYIFSLLKDTENSKQNRNIE